MIRRMIGACHVRNREVSYSEDDEESAECRVLRAACIAPNRSRGRNCAIARSSRPVASTTMGDHVTGRETRFEIRTSSTKEDATYRGTANVRTFEEQTSREWTAIDLSVESLRTFRRLALMFRVAAEWIADEAWTKWRARKRRKRFTRDSARSAVDCRGLIARRGAARLVDNRRPRKWVIKSRRGAISVGAYADNTFRGALRSV